MTIKEQTRRILKAAPHLPMQALTSIAILLFGIPTLLNQMFDSGFIQWVETVGIISTDRGVQERARNGKPEYFYSIDYKYSVDGQTFCLPFENGYDGRDFAEDKLKEIIRESQPRTLWYDREHPANATFDREKMTWPSYLGLLGILILLLLYFRWLMLKYYELELNPAKS